MPFAERRALLPDPVTGDAQFGWTNGEIILGGGGSDLMVGEGGDDIIDGDSSLKVAISTPDPAIRTGPLGQALLAAKRVAAETAAQAAADQAAADAAAHAAGAAVASAEAAGTAAAAAADAISDPSPSSVVMASLFSSGLNEASASADLGLEESCQAALDADTAVATTAATAARSSLESCFLRGH